MTPRATAAAWIASRVKDPPLLRTSMIVRSESASSLTSVRDKLGPRTHALIAAAIGVGAHATRRSLVPSGPTDHQVREPEASSASTSESCAPGRRARMIPMTDPAGRATALSRSSASATSEEGEPPEDSTRRG